MSDGNADPLGKTDKKIISYTTRECKPSSCPFLFDNKGFGWYNTDRKTALLKNGGTDVKGIILAGGKGTRLYPLTLVTSKHLLPIYDKPMVYYPLAALIRMGIRAILLISTPQDIPQYERLLGDGSQFGISLSYKIQPSPDGIAQAFLLGEEFLGGDSCVLILGDNIFDSDRFFDRIRETLAEESSRGGAMVFCRRVATPQDFGIAELDASGRVLSLEEKPAAPKSSNAVTGLYILPPDVSDNARRIRPSSRGELEITSLLELYRAEGRLTAGMLEDDCFWIDAGSFDRLAEAADYVRETERRTDRLIGSPEAEAYRNGWLTERERKDRIDRCRNSLYGELLAKNR